MASKKTVIITLTIIFLLFGGALAVLHFTDRIAQNPEGTVGNTAGNLNNGGYFCQSEDQVFFSNPYDDGCLYRMTADEQSIQKLNNAPAMFLNAGGNYLYYFQQNASSASDLGFIVHNAGLYRCKKDGSSVFCLDRTLCQIVSLVDNNLYYQNAVAGAQTLQLARIGTDKENPAITHEYLVNPACARNGIIYYCGTQSDHYLYAYDTQTGEDTLVAEHSMWFPTLQGNTIYFMDVDHGYRLACYDLTTGEFRALTEDRIDCFNVSDFYIYYQRNNKETPALMRMQKDGSDPEVIAEGIFCDINLTSDYLYCRVFGTQMPIYHMPLNSTELTVFDGAKTAVIANLK